MEQLQANQAVQVQLKEVLLFFYQAAAEAAEIMPALLDWQDKVALELTM